MQEAYKDDLRYEILGGKIVSMSPRPVINHNRIAGNIYRIFSSFLKGKPCEAFGDGVDLYLSKKDHFVPDGMVVCDKNKIRPAQPGMTAGTKRTFMKQQASLNIGLLMGQTRQLRFTC